MSISDFYPGTITQDYGNANSLEPAGWHHGVDIAYTGVVNAPFAGVYDPAISSAYTVAEDVQGKGEILFLHVKNWLFGAGKVPITQGEPLASVLTVNPVSGLPFSQDGSYVDKGVTYTETGPHLHVETHSIAGAPVGSDEGVENPSVFFGNATPSPANNSPVDAAGNVIGGFLGSVGSTIGTTIGNINNAPSAINSPIHLGDWFNNWLNGTASKVVGPDPFGIQHAFADFGSQLQKLAIIFMVLIIAIALLGSGAMLESR